jgi:hypothetical protein
LRGAVIFYYFLFANFTSIYYIWYMTITQAINIPISRRLVIDLPREMPVGPAILTFTPAGEGIGYAQRKLGTLSGKMSVGFANDFAMTDEELVNL